MTKTLSLNARQWRVLLNDNLEQLKAGVHGSEALNEESLKQFCAQLDNMRMLAGAWFQVSQPVTEPVAQPMAVNTNGAEPVKKKRGRPPKAAQVQAMQ